MRGLQHIRPSAARTSVVREDEDGVTLLEVLFAIFLMSVAFLAILGGSLTAAKAAVINRNRTTAAASLQTYAEKLSQPVGATVYKPCVVPAGHPARTPSRCPRGGG